MFYGNIPKLIKNLYIFILAKGRLVNSNKQQYLQAYFLRSYLILGGGPAYTPTLKLVWVLVKQSKIR